MRRELPCIICPLGCRLTVSDESGTMTVTGNTCPRGAAYGIGECTHPVRTVTAVLRVSGMEDTMVSVKTAKPIPKEHIFDCMALLRKTEVSAPVKTGDVLLGDVFGTEIVATSEVG